MLLSTGGSTLASCSTRGSASAATLAPTLSIRDVGGGRVAFQDGIPVPTFTVQPRPRLSLDGPWRIRLAYLDTPLSLTDRSDTLRDIEREAGDVFRPTYDDSSWTATTIPGSWNSPPSGRTSPSGAWYRRHFSVPNGWFGSQVFLKLRAVNYIADVWLNGVHLGYHEGGSTPFAFDVTSALLPERDNVLVLRVDLPALGTRNDVVPWGLTDWWNYGGINSSVWLETTNPIYAARADAFPHLDGADFAAVVANGSPDDQDAVSLRFRVLPAQVTNANLTSGDPSALVAPGPDIASVDEDVGTLRAGESRRVAASVGIVDPDLWSPQSPALYVLRVTTLVDSVPVDDLYETFGLRTIAVAPHAPRLLLDGRTAAFTGVAIHDEAVSPSHSDNPLGGIITNPLDYVSLLGQAESAGANLVRADHHPPDPVFLDLADRLGLAVWEEIPLYHYTPETFDIALGRGLPQQMLAEMILRDQDHPSVLFHGFANESTGGSGRASALSQLRDLDRQLDGTRLTGQAAYGFDVNDHSSDPLDVAGFTFYYGVFYGSSAAADTEKALAAIQSTYPRKPVMILEFGRWADSRSEEPLQSRVLTDTYGAIEPHLDTNPGGNVGAAVWWSLDDYWTMRPGIRVEHFGLYRSDASARPAALAAAAAFGRETARRAKAGVVSRGYGVRRQAHASGGQLLASLAYGLGATFVILLAALLGLYSISRWRLPRPAHAR